MASDKYDFGFFMRVWLPMTISVVSASILTVLWIQKYGEEHYYSQISGENLQGQVMELKTDLRDIREQNNAILTSLGKIEGKLNQ